MDNKVITRASKLEHEVKQKMLDETLYGDAKTLADIPKQPEQKNSTLEIFDMGCGAPFGCGL